MGRIGRFGGAVLLFVVALLGADLLYGNIFGSPVNEYVQLGLQVLAVVLVFPLAAIFNAWRTTRIRVQREQAQD